MEKVLADTVEAVKLVIDEGHDEVRIWVIWRVDSEGWVFANASDVGCADVCEAEAG